MPRFAANLTMMFNEHAFLDRFAAAADAGFEAVEFLFPYEHSADEIRRRANEAGTQIVLFNMPPGNWASGERGMAVFPQRAGEFTAGLGTALSYARALGVPRLHMMAGLAPSSDPDARARYLSAIVEAADAAQACGVDVLLEPLNPRDMPGYFLDSFSMAADIIGALDRPNVKLQFDIYHCQILQGDVTTALRQLFPLIGHVQTAAVPLRNEPGTGELDDFHLFRLIDKLGYDGHIGCEYRPAGGTVEGLAWMERVTRPR